MPFSLVYQKISEITHIEKVQATLLGILLLFMAVIAFHTSQKYIRDNSAEIFAPLRKADSIQVSIFNNTLVDTTRQMKILKSQYEVCERLKVYHTNLAVIYYRNYYAFSICSILFTTLLTIAVFLVANSGWQNASLLLRTFLLMTILMASIFYFLPTVLNNKNNLQSNVDKIKTYYKVQSNILNFSNLYISSKKKLKADSAISSHNIIITNNFDVSITIDDSKISTNPADMLQGIKP
ncbi:MAG TPA: hypothetical protein VL947_08975 [Cytophagales bacterium]|nr:hypothetical protein [Cytophagales bacterium]